LPSDTCPETEEKRLDLFEYILVITSVIYALAIAQVLSGIGRLAQTDAAIRRFLPHTLWVVILFTYVLLFWWAGWEFRTVVWTLPKYIYIMISPIFMFYSASLIIPARTDGPEVNLEKHFSKIKRPVLWSLFIAFFAQFADGPLLIGEPLWFSGRVLQAVLLCTVIWGVFVKNERLQVVPPIGVLLFFVFVSLTRLWTPGVIE
jgi:hypothetical protein